MHKFKVGDRATVVHGHRASYPRGGEPVTVVEVDENDEELPWRVVEADGKTGSWCYHDQLEPIGARRTRTLPEGSAERKKYPLFTGPMLYFPAALAAVAKLCKDGNDKHNPGEPMHHARSKSRDHADCQLRHLLDAHEGDGRDADGTPHVVMNAWRALALAQEWLEAHDGAPMAPAAKGDAEPGSL